MAIPKVIPLEHIKQLEDDESNAFNQMIASYDEQKCQSDDLKEQWLSVYAQSLSPSVACKQTGISQEMYRRWRGKDPAFCRAINRAIEGARDELLGSVLVRATGYTREDPNKPGEIETDFDGKPIYHGASDTLAKELLRLDTDTGPGATTPVNISIDMGKLLGACNNVVQIDDQRAPVIEHDSDDVA